MKCLYIHLNASLCKRVREEQNTRNAELRREFDIKKEKEIHCNEEQVRIYDNKEAEKNKIKRTL